MAPKFGDRLIVVIKQREIAKAAFDAIDRTIDSMTKIVVFSRYKPNPCREKLKE
jgi:hypothetical protein